LRMEVEAHKRSATPAARINHPQGVVKQSPHLGAESWKDIVSGESLNFFGPIGPRPEEALKPC